MSFSKVVLIIVTLIVLDYAQVAAQEDLQVAESKGKKYPRHIQPNVRPTQQRRRSFSRNPVRGRSDSSENGDEENGPPGYVILSYGGRLGKGTKGQRYGNKYGSDYSVEYVGNLYGYEDGHGYDSGYNSGYNSGHSGVANIQHGTSTGDGSHESDGSKGNVEPMGDLSVLAVDTGSDGTKDNGGSMDDSIVIGGDGINEDSQVNADTIGKGTGTAATDGSIAEETPIVAVDAKGIEASKGKDEVMVDSVITSEDATLSIDGMETGGETFGGEGVKVMEAIDEIVPLIEGDVTGSVVATKTVGTMDELMALLGDIGGSEGSTSPVKSMDDLIAIMGEAEGIEGISDIAGLTGDTTGIDGSIGNFGTTGSVLDTFATGGQDGSNSGTEGSVEEGATSLSAEEEYTFSVDVITEDETMDHVTSGKFTNANERNPFADSLVMDENGDLASVTSDTVKASASYTDPASGTIITEKSKTSSVMSEIDESFQPVVKAEALTAMEETGQMVIQTADMVTIDGQTEGTSLMDTGSAPSSGSEQSSAPSIASEGTSNNQRRMGRNGHDSRRPINYRNGDRRSIAVVKGHHPGNRARPQNRAISSKPVENLKYVNLPGNGEKIHNIHPGSVRNVPMNKPSRQVPTSSMPVNGGSRFRSIGEGNSAPRGMKENEPMGNKSVRSSPGNGNNKAMPVIVELVSKEAGSVNAAPLTQHSKNGASSNPSGSAGSGKKRFLNMGKGRNTSGNSGKLEVGSGSNKSAKHPSGSEEKGKKAFGNGDKMNSHGGKGSTRPARPAQLMSPPPSEEKMPPKSTMGDTSKPDMASENQEQGESTSEKPSGKGKRGKKPKNSVKEKRQISGSTSGLSSSSEKGKNGSEKNKGKETDASESSVKTSSGGSENVNGDEGRQNNGFVRNAPHNIVRYLRKGIGRYL